MFVNTFWIDCCLQVCGDPDLGAVQTLHGEDEEHQGVGICRSPGSQSAQTKETKDGERPLQWVANEFVSPACCKEIYYIKTSAMMLNVQYKQTQIHKICAFEIRLVASLTRWQITTTVIFVQIAEHPSELGVPEHMHRDETEQTLLERIKSIKQERWAEIVKLVLYYAHVFKVTVLNNCFVLCRVDLVIGLPDLEQENSDNDNLSSMSSESLEDVRGNMEWEGQ